MLSDGEGQFSIRGEPLSNIPWPAEHQLPSWLPSNFIACMYTQTLCWATHQDLKKLLTIVHVMTLPGQAPRPTLCIVGKKRDLGILDPMIFSGKIRKNRKIRKNTL